MIFKIFEKIIFLFFNLYNGIHWETKFFYSSRRMLSLSLWLSGCELYIIMKLRACLVSKLFHSNNMIYWEVVYHIPHLQRPDSLYFSTTKCSLEFFITAIWINASCYSRKDQTETSTEVQDRNLIGIERYCDVLFSDWWIMLSIKKNNGSKIEQAPRAWNKLQK